MSFVSYKVGDVVCLKSGGVNMVVGDVNGGVATCQWHDANGSYNAATFRLKTLMPVSDISELDKQSNYGDEDLARASLAAHSFAAE